MTEELTTSTQGIKFIKRHEALRLTAYRCPGGVLTIGYGHTRGVKAGQVITETEAERLLQDDLLRTEIAVNRYVKVKLEQHQFDALVSLTFNIGPVAFKRSTLLFLVNQGANANAIETQFRRWIYADGKPSPGLKTRREDEIKMYKGHV